LSQRGSNFGLDEDWERVVKSLEKIIPVYDKTNRYISLGTDLDLRKEGLGDLKRFVGKDNFSVLDLGCGTGKMSQLLGSDEQFAENIVLADPLLAMLRVARSRIKSDAVMCVYEKLPFRFCSFDAAMAGFSLRDAKNLVEALGQVRSVLQEGGAFLIVDLSKPDSHFGRFLISLYWRIFAPIIAFLAAGSLGLLFRDLYRTFKRLPKKSELFDLFRRTGFVVAESKFRMLGGACVIILKQIA
jgi:demethylmenaquinone methyltransferase / 2-methoxy-6-polyprenyl-1,4-benzoquinol methylase